VIERHFRKIVNNINSYYLQYGHRMATIKEQVLKDRVRPTEITND